jgi:glycosyltransferase involved in cell wall biosynthesis
MGSPYSAANERGRIGNSHCNAAVHVAPDRVLNVLAFLEAYTVTGPATNLLQFQRTVAARAGDGSPDVRLTIAVFQRGRTAAHAQLAAAAAAANVPVIAIAEGFRGDPRTIARVRRLTRDLQPDIVQTHSVKSHLLARLAVPRVFPWIAFHHGYTRPDRKMAVYNRCDRVSLGGADRVVTPARAFVAEIEACGVARERIAVVHNAFEIDPQLDARAADNRRRLRAALGVARHERVVVCVGRLSEEKGHADLVDAIAMLRAQAPALPLRVVIAGDGPERNALAARAARLGVGDRIGWLGFVPRAHDLYAAADAAVLPSHSEGSPNALLEAAAYRVPIVATAVGGVAEILTHGESGLLVRARRPDALASALRDVLVDTLRAADLGRQARRIVETRHDPAARARALVALYHEVTARAIAPAADRARACAY